MNPIESNFKRVHAAFQATNAKAQILDSQYFCLTVLDTTVSAEQLPAIAQTLQMKIIHLKEDSFIPKHEIECNVIVVHTKEPMIHFTEELDTENNNQAKELCIVKLDTEENYFCAVYPKTEDNKFLYIMHTKNKENVLSIKIKQIARSALFN